MTNCHKLTSWSPIRLAGWKLAWVILASLLVLLTFIGCTVSPVAQPGTPGASSTPEWSTGLHSTPSSIALDLTQIASSANVQVTPTPQAHELDPSLPGVSTTFPSISEILLAVTPCSTGQCSYPGCMILSRPIALPANDQVDTSYRFGSTQNGLRDPHHGVELLNRGGTPVLAAADGFVLVAGNDQEIRYSPYLNYYGNLVIIQHELPSQVLEDSPAFPIPIYTLYAHLSQISVEPGQVVTRGQQVGLVGMTGNALGNHLHFEIRLGENTYLATRNPELWLESDLDAYGQLKGAIAGRVIDSKGHQIAANEVVIQYLPEGPEGATGRSVYLNSYEESALIGQPPWQESFAAGNLPAGWYRVSFPYLGMQSQLVHLLPGQIVVVVFQLK
jgi:murein DD-endopeptidase MepM/ murein hydrolase activator NlpD